MAPVPALLELYVHRSSVRRPERRQVHKFTWWNVCMLMMLMILKIQTWVNREKERQNSRSSSIPEAHACMLVSDRGDDHCYCRWRPRASVAVRLKVKDAAAKPPISVSICHRNAAESSLVHPCWQTPPPADRLEANTEGNADGTSLPCSVTDIETRHPAPPRQVLPPVMPRLGRAAWLSQVFPCHRILKLGRRSTIYTTNGE